MFQRIKNWWKKLFELPLIDSAMYDFLDFVAFGPLKLAPLLDKLKWCKDAEIKLKRIQNLIIEEIRRTPFTFDEGVIK